MSGLEMVLEDANDLLGDLIQEDNHGREETLWRFRNLTERLRDLERYGEVEITVKERLS